MPGIGLLNEKPLHAALKAWYARPGDSFEVPVDGYVIDIVRGDQLIEIQTGGFSRIKAKLASLLASHPVRVIHPIVQDKWIVRTATARGRRLVRRKSPKRGALVDAFYEMVRIPHLISNPKFSLEVLIIQAEEVWRYAGGRHWRRRGWVIQERRLLEVLDRRLFQDHSDWRALLPPGLVSFTARELATALDMGMGVAQKMAYCLRKGLVIDLIGKRGRAHLYRAGWGVPSSLAAPLAAAVCEPGAPESP